MKKGFITVLFFALAFTAFGSGNADNSGKDIVAVSVVPEKAFVDAVSGGDFEVVVSIPPGSSPANYEPSPKERMALSNAKVYFTIGVPTEKANVLGKISSNTKVVHLEEFVSAKYPDRFFSPDEHHHHDGAACSCGGHDGRDPHIWLSPKRVIVMVEVIRDELSMLKPENAQKYEQNAAKFIAELKAVDKELVMMLKNAKSKTFFVFHPAFGYFADDYGLKMHALEQDGKEASLEHMMELVQEAKKENAKAIFYQAEIDSSQSKAFAQEIGGKTIMLEPLSYDYIANLKKIAKLLMEVNEK